MIVVKIGGAALENPDVLASLAQDLAVLRSAGKKIVLVHGGGPSINRALTARGISWNFIDGQRVTTPEMMDVIEHVLAREVNSSIVGSLSEAGAPVTGVLSAENGILQCVPSDERLGQVGKIVAVQTQPIHAILSEANAPIPVVTPIGLGADGKRFNINADWAACRIAEALRADQLIFLTDQPGILDKAGQLIPAIDSAGLEGLISDGTVQGGMLAKTRTILYALGAGISSVRVAKGDGGRPVTGSVGTDCVAVAKERTSDYAYA